MKPVAVVDGANVAYQEKSNDGKAKMENLTNMRNLLMDSGYRPVIITDASLRYHVDDRRQFDQLENEGIVKQAPAGTEADYFVLETAQQEDAVVISNDQYEKYQSKYPWIRVKRIPFMIVDSHITLYCPEEKAA